MKEEIEVLEAALKAVQQKYGYNYIDVAISATHALPYDVIINYPDGKYSHEGRGVTLREALAQASADALNNGATREAAK